jgi:hypothetical protein
VSEDSQIIVPPSFIALFVPPGGVKPRASRQHIAERYELCEDLAQMLTDTASTKLFELGVTEADVLERIGRGLLADASLVDETEARWVLTRLAELLGWPWPMPGSWPGPGSGSGPGSGPIPSR